MRRAAAALACLLGLAAAAPAQAAWPGENGAIVFARNSGRPYVGTYDLWFQTRDGRQRRLTATPDASEFEATVSPDGRTIAFLRETVEDFDIWLMNSDGTGQRPLLEEGFPEEGQPAFLPGGRGLVFAAGDGEWGWDVFTVREDGTGLKRLVSEAHHPVVSPDGRLLAYLDLGGSGGIRLRNLRTGKVRELSGAGGIVRSFDFSPDGRRLVFTAWRRCRPGGSVHSAILTIGIHDSHPRFLRRDCHQGFGQAAWAPDGKKIVFARFGGGRGGRLRCRLAMMSAEGAPLAGAPRHRRGTLEFEPSWQPLR